jgi:hypothetical protein
MMMMMMMLITVVMMMKCSVSAAVSCCAYLSAAPGHVVGVLDLELVAHLELVAPVARTRIALRHAQAANAHPGTSRA